MWRLLAGILSLALLATTALLANAALSGARVSGSGPLLPDLVADPPDNMVLVTSSIEDKTRLLLRFNGYVHNAGPGALDFRGSREKPKVTGKTETELKEEIQLYKYREESLPQSLEEELSAPAMKVSQRLFTTNEGNPVDSESYLERPHVEEASAGEMFYSDADGHHHWHLQHVAKYSLWNASKTAEVAPAQKVGFCLDDSQHVEANVGPSTPVYSNNAPPYLGFCRQFEPNATGVYEGISPGWRDVYNRELAFQWVDVSEVLPGEYWLREDVDPAGVIKQTGGGPQAEYAKTPTIIPGFDAEGQTGSVNEDEEKTVNLLARSYEDQATPLYTVVSKPQHGTLGAVQGSQVTYTPDAGYSGDDSFTFSARDPSSQFPEQPEVATVSIAVNSTQPSISISGAQAEMTAGTSVKLSAAVANDTGGVEWEASAGALAPEGFGGGESLYTAPSVPPVGGTVTVTARLKDDRAVSDERTITIKPVEVAQPAPEVPEPTPELPEPAPELPKPAPEQPEPSPEQPPATSSGTTSTSSESHPGGSTSSGSQASGSTSSGSHTSGSGTSSTTALGGTEGFKLRVIPPRIGRPRAMLVGRDLVMTTVPSAAGRVRLTAYLGSHEFGTCVTETPAGRTFTCRLTLRRGISPQAPIRVRASLRLGALLLQAVLPAQRIPEMKMRPVGPTGGTAASVHAIFWCSPSTLAGVLVGGGAGAREPQDRP